MRFDVLDEVGEAQVECDPARIQEVITNLLSAAASSSPVGETIFIGIRRTGVSIAISVSDHGPGSETRSGDGDRENTRRPGGHDVELGLDVARAILKQHRTDLHIEPRRGIGTRLWFTLREVPSE